MFIIELLLHIIELLYSGSNKNTISIYKYTLS
jgi:hypothetical protein